MLRLRDRAGTREADTQMSAECGASSQICAEDKWQIIFIVRN